MTTICSSAGLHTYHLEGRALTSIKFYRDGKVLFSTQSGWIERMEYPTKLPGLTLNNPIRRTTKLDLTKGGHFYISSGKTCWYNKRPEIDLYVDMALDDCMFGDERTVEIVSYSSGKTFHKVVTLTATFGTAGKQTIDMPLPNTTFVEKNAFGKILDKITSYMSKQGIDGIESIIKDKQLLDMLIQAHEIVKEVS